MFHNATSVPYAWPLFSFWPDGRLYRRLPGPPRIKSDDHPGHLCIDGAAIGVPDKPTHDDGDESR